MVHITVAIQRVKKITRAGLFYIYQATDGTNPRVFNGKSLCSDLLLRSQSSLTVATCSCDLPGPALCCHAVTSHNTPNTPKAPNTP